MNKRKKIKIEYNNIVLKIIALALTMVGTYAIAVLQNGLIKVDSYTMDTLLEAFNTDANVFGLSVTFMTCMAISAFALPVYAKLLLDGFQKTKDLKEYVIRVAVVALVSEMPYDYAMNRVCFDMSSQNPAMGMLIALIMLCIFRILEDTRGVKGVLLRIVIIISAVLWTVILSVSYGAGFVIMVALMWLFKENKKLAIISGIISSVIYFPAPLGFIFCKFYNGEKGDGNRVLFYFLYPLQYLAIGLLGILIY